MKSGKNRSKKQHRDLQDEQILEALEEVAERLSIKVHYERMKAFEFRVQDGSCKLKGESKIYIDSRHPIKDKVSILAQELGKYNLEEIYIPPLLREKVFLFHTPPEGPTPSEGGGNIENKTYHIEGNA